MASITRTDPNRDLLILGLRAEGVPHAESGRVFGIHAAGVSAIGVSIRRHVHRGAGNGVWGLVEKYGRWGVLIGGIDWF